ncbi:hypothetical protein AB0H43_27915 [Hamadaea sp. NPDC050747]|uniref:hypothetical protein n=1 Tax=Hamadaea sp. NPDC050747 TaxID=3155789 RepID=UPI0033C3699B
MAKEFTDGKPEKMREAASRLGAPSYGDDLVRQPAHACAGGMPECTGEFGCTGLFGCDVDSTKKVQELITHVRQGFAGFQAMIADCADLYATAAGMSRDELTAIVNRPPADGLPDREPRFDDPVGATP